jgi:hypothetical protein
MLLTGAEFVGAPRVERVTAELEFIGSFEGEYRSFSRVGLSRVWELQRVNGGPWRVAILAY